MGFQIDQTTKSIRDFYDILDYLAESLFSPSAVQNFSDTLETCYARLREHPFLYAACEDAGLAAKGFRLAPVMRYLVFYTVEEETKRVRIHRILHGSRDYSQQID
ncbi:MAG: type II toxin-antitoxin system RelE/ParE family toxin [Clostridiales bacterium]|nr:type II toxin-antitoxin system RelE/ParE family toxin [Clostridiales bacterium]